MNLIYKITNLVNGKAYIGKTSKTLDQRFAEHKTEAFRSRAEKRPLYSAMRKYGIENFKIELIEDNLSDDIVNEREVYWIRFYQTYCNGYNATIGGDGKSFYNHELFLQEFLKGKSVTEIAHEIGCSRKIVSETVKARGLNVRSNTPKQKGNKVVQVDPISKKTLNIFDSQRDAAQFMIDNNFSSAKKVTTVATNIGRVLKGERKSCCGFLWELA